MDLGVAFAAETEEVVVLRDNLSAWSREIQGEGWHVATEIIDVEDQILRQIGLLSPDHPPRSERRQAEFVTRSIDRLDPRETEVPHQIRRAEWSEESAAGRVDVDGNIQAGASLQIVECGGDRGDRFVVPCECHAERGHHADGVLVAALHRFLGRHDEAAIGHGDLTQLDVPIAREFLPANLHRTADEVRFVRRLSFGAAFGPPAPFHGHPAEHGRLAGPGGRTADGFRVGRVPQVGQHVYATRFDFGGLRVLVLVDHILVEALIHQAVYLGFLPRLAEGGEVLPRIAVQHQLVMDQLVSGPGRLLPAGELGFRQHLGRFRAGKNLIVKIARPGAFNV